jgi:hypothetical protein
MEAESSSETARLNQKEKNKIRVTASVPQNFRIALSCYNTVLSGTEQWMGSGRVEFVELAAGPTGCCKMASGGCGYAWNFSVTRSTVIKVAERKSRSNMALFLR